MTSPYDAQLTKRHKLERAQAALKDTTAATTLQVEARGSDVRRAIASINRAVR